MTDVDLPLPKVTGKLNDLFRVLKGQKRSRDLYNASGMLLGEQAALLRLSDSRQFVLAIEVDGEVYRASEVHCANPMIQALADRMTVFGQSPEELRTQEQAKRRAQMSPEEAQKEVEEMYKSWGLTVSAAEPGVKRTTNNMRSLLHKPAA
ncbi:hypothetical protein BA177_06155 [Woeseia oceani]|uniref:Uncharacterized protein n=1 Tax=Woeseia oceani TaxID=1548547 RepID=A0A193LEN6_9GAMM|nr:hypothetical protein BA177_06155 [Woeseia oceani]